MERNFSFEQVLKFIKDDKAGKLAKDFVPKFIVNAKHNSPD